MSQPRLQRDADARYRRYEMHSVPKAWRPRRERIALCIGWFALMCLLALLGVLLAWRG